ncbi:MAG: TolC family protein [Pseudomonadota bacterium]
MYKSVAVSLLAISLASCAVKPKPLTTGSVSSFAQMNLNRVTQDQEPITGEITLYEAMARAIKYNLDFQVELYNEALANRVLDTTKWDALPKLVSSAAYLGRSNDSGSRTSLVFSDKEHFTGNVSLSWNMLDLGLSYVRAKQASDEVLVARERRRKIINRVIEDVRTAYWRAVSADRLVAGLRDLEGRVRLALNEAKKLEKDDDASPLTALTYQRELVEIQKRIQTLQNDLSVAKTQLAALMNVRPGTDFKLAQPKRRLNDININMTGREMVFAALHNRPEIRDIQYKLRINDEEFKKSVLEILPTANLFVDGDYDSDSFLFNNSWVSWGARATWNVLRVFRFPSEKKKIDANKELLEQRALAITMAIMTQVHVSRARYYHARRLFVTSGKHLKIQRGILHQIRESAAAEQASDQTLIREEMNTLASRVSYDIAYADLQNAYANIFSSIGLDPYKEDLTGNESVAHLTRELRDLWIERGDKSAKVRSAKRAAAEYSAKLIVPSKRPGRKTPTSIESKPVAAGVTYPKPRPLNKAGLTTGSVAIAAVDLKAAALASTVVTPVKKRASKRPTNRRESESP